MLATASQGLDDVQRCDGMGGDGEFISGNDWWIGETLRDGRSKGL